MIALGPSWEGDYSKIVLLADEVFGNGYLTQKEVNKRFLVLSVNGNFAGFVNTDIWDEEAATNTESGYSLGLLETVVIHPEYRGVGLGNILVASAVAYLICEDVDVIECYATTWSDSGFCFIKGCLERNGFTAGQHYPRMWENDVQDFVCRACRTKPCVCDATLYRREVNTSPGEMANDKRNL